MSLVPLGSRDVFLRRRDRLKNTASRISTTDPPLRKDSGQATVDARIPREGGLRGGGDGRRRRGDGPLVRRGTTSESPTRDAPEVGRSKVPDTVVAGAVDPTRNSNGRASAASAKPGTYLGAAPSFALSPPRPRRPPR